MLPYVSLSAYSTETFNAAWQISLAGEAFPLTDMEWTAHVRRSRDVDSPIALVFSSADGSIVIDNENSTAATAVLTLRKTEAEIDAANLDGQYAFDVRYERAGRSNYLFEGDLSFSRAITRD